MNIAEYRDLVKKKLYDRLEPIGFRMQGDHIYLNQGDACFALLRVKDKWSNLTQQVKYLAVTRHTFLPDLEGRDIQGFVEHPSLYPFKMNPLKLSNLKKGIFKKGIKYKYVSGNLGHYETSNIDYGEVDPSEILDDIYSQISTVGLEWFASLTAKEAAVQIRENGNEDYIEKIWSQTYVQNGY
jgi:hypothetical protein